MLPRPARLRVRLLPSRVSAARQLASSALVRRPGAGPSPSNQGNGQVIHPSPHPPLDGTFHELLRESDMGMGTSAASGSRRRDMAAVRSRIELGTSNDTPSPPNPAFTTALDTSNGMEREDLLSGFEGLEIDEPPTSTSSRGRFGFASQADERPPFEAREERRSPATVLGSKRVGVVVLPQELRDGIQREINQLDNPRQLRESYLSLPKSAPPGKGKDTKVDHRSGKPRRTSESELAKAAGVLPGEYGVVRNIMREMDQRLGSGWLDSEEQVEVVEFSGGLGAGMWAAADALGALPSSSHQRDTTSTLKIQLVHSSRHGLDLAKKIAEDIPDQAVQLQFNRKHVSSARPPSLVLSTFNLSNLPTQPSQHAHLLHLLSLESPYLILMDRNTPSGWRAISRARQFLLDQSTSESPLHVVAPCPHDGACPLASMRDSCAFSQRIQRPVFTRKTKHSGRGEEDTGYCYVVIGRGERPGIDAVDSSNTSISGLPISSLGRVGGVGKEEAKKTRLKNEGKSVLQEIEGHEGVLEVVSLPESLESEPVNAVSTLNDVGKEELDQRMREEAYTWPRLVAPPMKRSGHVTMDACCPDGNIQRLTFSKSHSKQGYHDARKSSWGDLFPHVPKATPVIRTRGVRHLTEPERDDEGVLEEIMAGNAEEVEDLVLEAEAEEVARSLRELEGMGIRIPKAELAESEPVDHGSNATVWKSAQDGPFGKQGQKRGFASLSVSRPVTRVGLFPSVQSRSMSARPVSSSLPPRPKVTLSSLYRMSAAKVPISVITAYDYPTALLAESCGVDMLLVGDSLSQVALGHESTTRITLDEMIHHSKSVAKGAKSPFVFADMPFGSFEASLETGVANVIRLIKETGIDGVKIEGGQENLKLVKRLSEIGIPVMAHIGLQPQRATSLSGYLVQGRTAETAYEIYETAKKMQEAGAFGLLIEAVPRNVAKKITEELDIITIGIGAGSATNGQVLVVTDVLGVYAEDPVELSEPGAVSQKERLEPATQLALDDVLLPPSAAESAGPAQLPSLIEVNPIPTPSEGTAIDPSLADPSSAPSNVTETPASPPSAPRQSIELAPAPQKSTHTPRFVRQFGSIGYYARRAVASYVSAVKDGSFPSKDESYGMKKAEWEGFLAALEKGGKK